MLLEGQSADVHPGVAVAASPGCCAYGGPLDPCAGWYLVQRDWGARQGELALAGTGMLGRILALPLAAVHAIVRSLARC
jgi:hypothetical protein